MKVGDLVRLTRLYDPSGIRRFGVIVSFDEDDDPEIIWSTPIFINLPESHYRSQIIVLSETTPVESKK